MKAALIAFTTNGAQVSEEISQGLREKGTETEAYYSKRDFDSVYAITEKLFDSVDAIIFISACGIAVRAIAPLIKSKASDPAVIVCDELGRYSIPILSGHLGGANELALQIADITGGEAVITTATDINGAFSVDLWAKKNGLIVKDIRKIKEVSSRILKGETIGFKSEYPYEGVLPQGVCEGKYECGIYVGSESKEEPFPITLFLIPKNLILGIGCRRDTPEEKIKEAVFVAGINMSRVIKICSIDLKSKEPGLLSFADTHGLETEFFSSEELMKVKGDFTSSDYVKSVTGVDNVCERAAALGGGDGKLIIRKKAHDGVTVAVFEKNVHLRF